MGTAKKKSQSAVNNHIEQFLLVILRRVNYTDFPTEVPIASQERILWYLPSVLGATDCINVPLQATWATEGTLKKLSKFTLSWDNGNPPAPPTPPHRVSLENNVVPAFLFFAPL